MKEKKTIPPLSKEKEKLAKKNSSVGIYRFKKISSKS